MSRSGKLEYTARGMSQDAGDALRGDVVRGLVELITNADDAYMRSGGDGPIQIVIEHLDDALLSARIVVSDAATGMSAADMVVKLTRLGSRASDFGSGAGIRGVHGRGARDLAAFGVLEFDAVQDGKYSHMMISGNTWELSVEDEPVSDDILTRMSLEPGQNGTTVRVHMKKPLTVEKDVSERLSVHAELRHILDERNVTLTETGMRVAPIHPLLYDIPVYARELINTTVVIPGYDGATASFAVSELEEPGSGRVSAETNHGILIRGERAVYTNTLFDLEGRPGAGFLQGEFSCPLIEKLVKDFDDREERNEPQTDANPIRLLTRSRDGLIARHPLTKAIRRLFSTTLLPIIQDLEARHAGDRRPSDKVQRRLERAGRELGRILADDLAEIDEPTEPGFGDAQSPLKLIPARVSVRPNEKKTLTVHARPQLLPESWDGDVTVELDLSNIVELVGLPDPFSPHPNNEDLLVSRIRFAAMDRQGEVLVTVRAGTEKSTCVIRVDASTPPPPSPPETLEFSHQSYSLRPGRKRSIELVAPLDLLAGIEAAATVHYEGGAGIDLLTSSCVLRLDEGLGWYRGRLTLLGDEVGSRGTVYASLNGLETSAEFNVVKPSDPKGLDLEIKWEDRRQGAWRAALTKEPTGLKLLIFGRHSVIEHLLGPWDEEAGKYKHDDSQEVGLVLSEIVATEMAHHLLEREFSRPGRDFDAPTYAANYRRRVDRYLQVAQRLLVPQT